MPTTSAPPSREIFGPESRAGRVVRTLLTFLLCAQFTLEFAAEKPFLALPAYAAGQERTPYQFRVLPMLLMRPLDGQRTWQHLAGHIPGAEHSPEALTVLVLAFISMLVAVYATRATILVLTGDRSLARWLCLLVPVMSFFTLCSTWGLNYSLPYDVPSLALFAVCLWLIVSGSLTWLLPAFLLATLDRETSLFLLVFLAVWGWRSGVPRARLAVYAGLLFAVWLGTKIVLAQVFRGNPAEIASRGLFTHHVSQNLRFLLEPQQWPVLLSVCGFTLPLLFLGRRWMRNRAYEHALFVTLALWFCGMVAVGVVIEIRIFDEWTAFVVPALALMVIHRFRATGGGPEPAP